MERISKGQGEKYAAFFSDFEWNYVPQAILEGVYGEVQVDDPRDPHVVALAQPKLKLFVLGGNPQHPAARSFVEGTPAPAVFFYASEAWETWLKEILAGGYIEDQRYAFTSDALDRDHLTRLAAAVPEGYRAARLDFALAEQLLAERSEFASSHMVNFDSTEDFIERGFGWCLLHGDEIASVASTFMVCSRGIEIQINTREAHRQKGLATITAANLMLESLERGLTPNWDAANLNSGGLAQKLGCVPQGEYSIIIKTK